MTPDEGGSSRAMKPGQAVSSLANKNGADIATPPRDEVAALTGIRGVAALLVAVYHYFLPVMPVGSVAYRLFGRGYLYVDLFFVLSGYVMAVNYGQMFIGRWRISAVRIFLLKRFARVYPLYGCVMLALVVGYWMRYGAFEEHEGWVVIGLSNPWLEIPLNATLMQSWGLSKSIVGQAWSVSTEMAAYLMFPWLAPLILRRGRTPSFPAILFGASALPLIAVWLAHGDGKFHAGTMDIWDGPPALLRCLGGFVLGMCLHRITLRRWVRFAFTDTFGLATVAAYGILLLSAMPDLVLYFVFPLLILCLAGNEGRLGRACGSRPIYVLGLLSYAFYLLHVYFIEAMDSLDRSLSETLPKWLAGGIAALSAAIAVLGLSAAAYLCIEKPGRRLLRGIIR